MKPRGTQLCGGEGLVSLANVGLANSLGRALSEMTHVAKLQSKSPRGSTPLRSIEWGSVES